MVPVIVPVARALALCDYYVGYENGKVDLYGLFNAIRPREDYPYTTARFCVFAQLANGLGQVPFFVDIRDAATDELIHVTGTNHLHFPDRSTLVRLALFVEGVRFDRPGLYFLDLFCDNTWVCGTDLRLLVP